MISCVALVCAASVVYVSASVNKAGRELVADELRGLNDAQALLTAESGLMVGTDAFRNGWQTPGTPIKMEHAGSEVTIELVEDGARDGFVRITSTARHNGLDYDKRVEWQVAAERRPLADGTFGYFPRLAGVADGDTASGRLVKARWREADVPRN
jgi:hypothetical protein